MNRKNDRVACWETFRCEKKDCPAYRSRDMRCWLRGSTHCHDAIDGSWLEKMEACLRCEVFDRNFTEGDWQDTFAVISRQFETYRQRMEEEQELLRESRKRLQEFKTTSIYLLQQLDKKTREVQGERDNLERRVEERTAELSRAQDKLVQTTKMAAIGRFSAGIAHEINNPLGAIINYVRTLVANPEIKDQTRGYLELIAKGLFRIEHIVKQVLSYSGRQHPEPEPCDVNRLIHEALAFSRLKHSDKNIQVDFHLAEGLPSIHVSPTQIQQVFVNIINNALDASDTSGKVRVHSRLKRGRVEVSFADSGRGMDPEDLAQIFDPFYSTKEVGSGTGLGLFISYNILQLYDGTIDVQSKKGEGTTVTVRFPVPSEG